MDGPWTTEIYFSHFWRLGDPRSEFQDRCVLVKALFLVRSWHRLAVFSHGGRGERALWGLFYKNVNPIIRTPLSWPKKLSRRHLLMPSLWALGFQCMNLWRRHKHSDQRSLGDDSSLQGDFILSSAGQQRQAISIQSKTWGSSVVFLRYSLPFLYPGPMRLSPRVPTAGRLCYLESHFIYEALTPSFVFPSSWDGCKLWFFYAFNLLLDCCCL